MGSLIISFQCVLLSIVFFFLLYFLGFLLWKTFNLAPVVIIIIRPVGNKNQRKETDVVKLYYINSYSPAHYSHGYKNETGKLILSSRAGPSSFFTQHRLLLVVLANNTRTAATVIYKKMGITLIQIKQVFMFNLITKRNQSLSRSHWFYSCEVVLINVFTEEDSLRRRQWAEIKDHPPV